MVFFVWPDQQMHLMIFYIRMKIQAISGISHGITNTIGPQNRGQKCVASFFAVTLPFVSSNLGWPIFCSGFFPII
jgi:hypothetical protein